MNIETLLLRYYFTKPPPIFYSNDVNFITYVHVCPLAYNCIGGGETCRESGSVATNTDLYV